MRFLPQSTWENDADHSTPLQILKAFFSYLVPLVLEVVADLPVPPHHIRDDIHGDGEHDCAVFLRRNVVQGL